MSSQPFTQVDALTGRPFAGALPADAPAGLPRDFVTRFFAPQTGVPEDPVTGSAYCTPGPLWGARWGRSELVGEQVSPRGGIVWVRLAGDRGHLDGVLHEELHC